MARAQLTRAQTDELELRAGDIVYIRPPEAGPDVAGGADSGAGGEPAPATA